MIALEPNSGVDPFEQIRCQIADQVKSGQLLEGQRLPSIRQLAADLRVSPGTVAKAYSVLEGEGLVESSRTRGTRVTKGNVLSPSIQIAAQHYAAAVRELDLEEALGAVRIAWQSLQSEST